MSIKMYGALIASLCAVSLICAPDASFAAGPHGGSSSARSHSHSRFHSPFARHRNRIDNGFVAFFPDDNYYGDYYNQPPGGPAGLTQPIPNDVGNANANEIPWDWAHRYPPLVVPSDKPYVASCPTETIKVPGHFGQEQSINITRCY
jgi:hypothetical protein